MYLWATSFIKRDTQQSIPLGYFSSGGGNSTRYFTSAMKRSLSYDELRALSKTPLARSAINQIREGILNLPYEIVSLDGKAHKKDIELVNCYPLQLNSYSRTSYKIQTVLMTTNSSLES